MKKTLYTNVNLFDGNNDTILFDSCLLVNNDTGRIESVGEITDKKHCTVVDLGNSYAIPGMIDAHTHTMLDPDENSLEMVSETEVTLRSLINLRKALNAGVTTVRECGSAYNTDIKLSKRIKKTNTHSLPTIIPYGRPISMTGGHGDFGTNENNLSYLTDSQDEMRKAVRTAFKYGAQGIKVMASGGVLSPNDDVNDTALSLDEIKVACQEAHNRGKKVAAHAQGNLAINNALFAGVDSIEHGIFLDKTQAEFMVENNVYLVPTLNAVDSILKYGANQLPKYMLEKTKKVQDDFYKNMAMAYKTGVQFVVGTDAGTPFNHFGSSVWNELKLLTEIGFSNSQALKCATQNAADLLQIDKDYGTLEAGKYADFVVLSQNPLKDITALSDPQKQVFKKGTAIKPSNMGV
ncbi:amidohydrolase family protein [Lactiplantibacillus plantarum]|nr:amidohydrolase family protein [Lactiplantibacillus plantarum]